MKIGYQYFPKKNGGEGGIRTHGTLPHNGFQDRHLQPLGHLSFENILPDIHDFVKPQIYSINRAKNFGGDKKF